MARGKKTGGRSAGTPNKSTGSLREVAQKYTADALQTLVDVMQDEAQPAAARTSAATAILDRGNGRPVAGNDAAERIIGQFLSYEISAIKAGLLLEAAGLQVGGLLQKHIEREVRRFDDQNKTGLFDAPPHLPRA